MNLMGVFDAMKRTTSFLIGCVACLLIFPPAPAVGQQNVLLDFDSGTDGTVDYTAEMRDSVQSLMEDIYQDFDISFSQFNPGGVFSRLTFNSGGAGGLAEDIDFRNLNKGDNAVINVDGLGFTATNDIVGLTANIGAHELGHILGLRHHDSFGPIGQGVIPGIQGNFLPNYTGPQNADEFENHVMSTPALGADINRFTQPVWLSERSAIKLEFAENGTVDNEVGSNDTIATAQDLVFGALDVPNTIIDGQFAGMGDFDVDAIAMIGSLTANDTDFYQFSAEAGDLFNFEVMSSAPNRLANVDTQITILDSTGAIIDYYGSDAFNDDEIEGLDSVLVDLVIADAGTYFVQVNAFDATGAGHYELFASRFNGITAVPEPGCATVLAVLGTLMVSRRKRVL
jgi:hypothetical protein